MNKHLIFLPNERERLLENQAFYIRNVCYVMNLLSAAWEYKNWLHPVELIERKKHFSICCDSWISRYSAPKLSLCIQMQEGCSSRWKSMHCRNWPVQTFKRIQRMWLLDLRHPDSQAMTTTHTALLPPPTFQKEEVGSFISKNLHIINSSSDLIRTFSLRTYQI